MVKNFFIAGGAFLLMTIGAFSCCNPNQHSTQFGADSVATDSVAVDSVTVDSTIQESQMIEAEAATCEPSSSHRSSSYSSNPAMNHIRTQRNYNAYRPYKW